MASPSIRSYQNMRVAVVMPALLVLAALLVASSIGLYGLSTARAFVGAEGLWSKSASGALQSLERYIERGQQDDLTRFQQAVQVPLSMRDARAALQTPGASLETAARHFVDAGVVAEDALLMCYVYRLAQHLEWTQTTVAAWESGDRFIDELIELAVSVRDSWRLEEEGGTAARLHAKIVDLGDRFSMAQRRFSDRIGERSRWAAHVSVLVIGLFAGLLAGTAAFSTLRLQRRDEESRRQLMSAHQRLKLATQSDHLGVFEWEVGQDFMWLDARCCEIYGLQQVQDLTPVDKASLWTRVPPEDHGKIQEVMEQAARQRAVFKHRYRVVPAAEQVRHVEITGIFTKTSGSLRMTGVIRDITQEVSLTKAEADARAEEMSAQTRSRLLSRLSHELRTPLNAILGFTQLFLVTAREMAPQQRSWIEEIDKAGRGLLRMIDDVLRISALAEGGVKFRSVAVDMRDSLAGGLAALNTTQQSRVELRVPECGGLECNWGVLADPEGLSEAFARLIAHVLRMDSSGRTVVVTMTATSNEVAVELAARGWDAQHHDSASRLTEPPATHLGFDLALVESLLNHMGGRLQLGPQPGGGTLAVLRMTRCPTS